jgi:hypothetical protein
MGFPERRRLRQRRDRCAALASAVFAGAAAVTAAIGLSPRASADPIGVNLDGMAYYFTQKPWVDAKDMFAPWFHLNDFGNQNSSPPLTSDGYPLVDATTITQWQNYPDGTYQVSYQGTGTFTWGGMHPVITNTQYNAATDTTSYDLTISRQGDDLMVMNLVGVNPNNPVHNLHIITPGYTSNQTFTTDFLRRTRPFGTLRFMDWMATNANPVVNWSDRATPADFTRTTSRGVPYEEIISLANTVNHDIWINVPGRANDDYVKHMADMFRDDLNPDIKIHLEYSNEVWNAGFQQFFDNLFAARQNPNLTLSDDFGRSAEQYAVTTKHVDDIFRQEFGSSTSSRLSFVYGTQAGNTYWTTSGLGYIQSHYGNANQYFNEVAMAPYFGNDLGAANTPTLTADQLFANLQTFIDTTERQWIHDQKMVANQYGLALSAYEGGQSLTNLANPNLNTTALQLDPRMGTLTGQLIDVWNQEGGGLFMNFSHIGPFWGLLLSQAQPGTPKWDEILSRILLPGDANLDGVVDAKDLLILAENYDQSGRWWEQGDFNHDGIVNALDLQMLASHYGQGTLFDGGGPAASTAAAFAADWATAQAEAATVPEPGGVGVLMLGVAAALLRRQRRRLGGAGVSRLPLKAVMARV